MTKQDHILHRSWELPNTDAAAQQTCTKILKHAAEQGFNEDATFGIHLALEEAFTNALKHGNQSNPNKKICVEFLITPEKMDISITDEGQGFDPDDVPDPRCNQNLYKISGRGVLLIKAYMDIVEYNKRGNCVHMVKYRHDSRQSTPRAQNGS
ncbi:MAG: ATP-binding protein [Phycisphaerae bacterium]|nr:ATP-binding protein [Phycisphaerae bacterium]